MKDDLMPKYMNKNVKLYPTYLSLIFDVLFVWTISTLFFTTQKGLTFSQVISLDSFLMLFGALLSIPINQMFRRVGSLNATRIGLMGYAGYLLLCILGTSYPVFVLAQVFLAFGYLVCGLRGNDVIVHSLDLIKRGGEYQKHFGKGLSMYYIFEAVGAVVITYVYNWRPYAAYFISLAVVGVAFLYSFLLTEPGKFMKQNVDLSNAKTTKAKKEKQPDSYFKIIASSFFISLLAYIFVMRGVLSISVSNFKIYLQQSVDANIIPLWLFGYFVAGAKICSAITSRLQFKFNMRFGVKSLLIFSSLILITFYTNAILYILNPTNIVFFIMIAVLSLVQAAIFPPCRIFVNNYMQVCLSAENINKGYTIRTMVEYFGFATISAIYAGILAGFNNNYGLTNLVYIAILTIPVVLSTFFFIRALIKKHAQKFTIIKDEFINEN